VWRWKITNRKFRIKTSAMPPRSLVLAIVFFWVATTGWLFYRDLWPRLRSGQPPPYTIDLADEAQRSGPPIPWNVFRGHTRVGEILTGLEYRESDDTFELHSKAAQPLDWGQIGPFWIRFKRISSMYRVTRDGRLREIVADVTIDVRGIGLMRALGGSATAHIAGKVEDRRFVPRGWMSFGESLTQLPLEPVEVASEVSVLNPLHPINRVTGLRKGQHWQMPLLNPLNDSLMALLKKDPGAEFLLRDHAGVRILQAEVLSETSFLYWKRRKVPCLVIEYRSDEATARTWVRESDGLVLRQEASCWGDQVVMVRDWTVETP
jgi:hypothetical protein